MKIRIKFSKHGVMKFIGHLDLQRFFQKAIRRSGIDIKFSEGMSPHMIMSFANPLGVGLTSDGEYFDIEINTPISTKEALEALNAQMCEGMQVLDFRQIEEGKASKGMSLVAAAEYTLKFREGYEPETDWQGQIAAFMAQEEIMAVKETKKGESLINIRPLIYKMEPFEDGVYLFVSAGSAANLKPELVMRSFASYAGFSLDENAILTNRAETYTDKGTPEKHEFVTLNDLGQVIE